jgi:competence protein ComEC
MSGRWGEIPFAALVLCQVLGIAVSRLVTSYLFLPLAVGTSVLAGAALLALLRERRAAALTAAFASVSGTALLLALALRDGYPSRDLRALLAAGALPLGELVPFDGCVSDQATRHADETVTTIEMRAFQKNGSWVPCIGGMILRIPDPPAGESAIPALDLRIGDRVRSWATWHLPRNFQNPGSPDHAGLLLRRGVSLVGRSKSPRLMEVIPGDCSNTWTRMSVAIQDELRNALNKIRQDGHPEQAAILSSLIIGDYSGLDSDTRLAFQNSGTYHVLVVSGLHVAWIAAVLLQLFRLMRIPAGISRLLAAVLLFFYTGLVGFQASISRSLWMFILYLAGQALFRRAAPANVTLAAAFFLLAARPDWLFDIGFQLSFLAVLAICLMGLPLIEGNLKPLIDPLRHAGHSERQGFRDGQLHRAGRSLRTRGELLAEAVGDRCSPGSERLLLLIMRALGSALLTVGSMIVITISVQLWLEPLLAYHFNRLSWIAPAANLVAVPLSSLVLASGMIAAFAAHVTWLAAYLLRIAGMLSDLLLQSARFVSALPGAWQRCPTPPLYFVLAGIALLFAWCFSGWRRKWLAWLYIAVLLICLSVGWSPIGILSSRADGGSRSILSLTFLDVGQGDAMVLRFPDGRIWIVDAGGIHQTQSHETLDRGFDVGEAVVSRYLWHEWTTRIERAVLSHPDVDHVGGMPAVIENFRISGLVYAERIGDPTQSSILRLAGERIVSLIKVAAGKRFISGDVEVEVLNPPEGREVRSTNEDSVVLRIRYRRFSALLTGDLEKAGERDFLIGQPEVGGLLLKAAHHGSRSATTDSFLERVRPLWTVLSSGRNNPYGHPSKEVIFRLLRHGSRLLLTQDLGAITFETDGNRYLLRSHVSGVLGAGLLPAGQAGRQSEDYSVVGEQDPRR